MRLFFFIMLGLTALIAAPPVHADAEILGETSIQLAYDYAVFNSDDSGKGRLEIYYQIFNSALDFKPVDDVYEAEYRMTVEVEDNDVFEGDKYSKIGAVRVRDVEASRYDYRTNQVSFDLPQEKYKIKLTLENLGEGRRTLKGDFKVKVEAFDEGPPRLSDIELVQAVGQRDTSDNGMTVFNKGDYMVIPSVTGGFGGDGDNPLLFYIEIYRGTEDIDKVKVQTLLRRDGGSMVYRDTLWTDLDQPVVRQLRNISVADYEPDEYELEVTLLGRRDRKLDKKTRDFIVSWSVAAQLEHDYDAIVDQIAYIAEKADMEELKDAETQSERKAAFDAFWQKLDPTPGSSRNEIKVEFYRRVRVANERFSYLNREGWKTDRGRIYIEYGEPDRIEDYPIALGSKPYQKWHYYRDGRYRLFTFVDFNEDGDYRLQFPYDGSYDGSPDF